MPKLYGGISAIFFALKGINLKKNDVKIMQVSILFVKYISRLLVQEFYGYDPNTGQMSKNLEGCI